MVPAGALICGSGWMKKGIEIRLGSGDRERLDAAVGKRRAEARVAGADCVAERRRGGHEAIQRQTSNGRQADDLALAGALHGRGVSTARCMRPPERPASRRCADGRVDRAGGRDDAGRTARRGNALNRSGEAQGGRDQPSQRAADLGGAWAEAPPGAHFSSRRTTRSLLPGSRKSSASMSIRLNMLRCSRSTKTSQIQELDRTQQDYQ